MRYAFAAIMLAAASFAAFGQEAALQSTIETQGVATVDAVPAYVEFWIHAQFTGATLVEATSAAQPFESNVRKALQAAELAPTEITFTGIAVPDVNGHVARISVQVKFRASAYTGAEDGPRLFAGLCDKMATLASGLTCKIEGPTLTAEDKESIEDAAIARATEKAYVPAKAAAHVMNGQVTAVDKVTIEGAVWNKVPGVNAAQPDLQRLTCTATVRVSYAFSPAQ